MRVQSNYGNTVFDTRENILNSQSKIRKIVVYLILTAFSIYIGKVVLDLNLTILNDLIQKIINGETISIDSNYFMGKLQSNEIIAYIFSIYYFFERGFFVIKDYAFLMGEKAFDIGKNLLSVIE